MGAGSMQGGTPKHKKRTRKTDSNTVVVDRSKSPPTKKHRGPRDPRAK